MSDSKDKGVLVELKQFYRDSVIFLKQCEKPDAKGKHYI
jgi:preprotein translocase subunit Sss1